MSESKDWLKLAKPTAKLERMEAFFNGHGFTPHRHDTYAIGQTIAGVHCFNYRKSMRHSLPGQAMVLYPDELHDGESGTQEGFRYRILYIPPEILQKTLGGQPLPYIPSGVSSDPRITSTVSSLLERLDGEIDPLEEDDGIYDLAHALAAVAGHKTRRRRLNYRAAELAREYMLQCAEKRVTLDDLEDVSGADRWSLSRDFRVLYGTSPYRYLTQRRLDRARALMREGHTLVEVAACAGFTDQSHMTHHFKKSYGLPPGRWMSMLCP